MKKIYLEETTSTNEFILKFLDAGEDTVVCAARQTSGKGTKGRSFSSSEGGVYLSALRFFQDFPAGEAFRVMMHSAAAVCKTAERFGVECEIKWPNDILAHGKKICGILIENFFSGDKLCASIVGIGLNVNNPLSGLPEAGRLSDFTKNPLEPATVREELIENFFQPFDPAAYVSRVKFLGQEIRVSEGTRDYAAIAREILPDGRLLIEEGGALRALSSAEIKITL